METKISSFIYKESLVQFVLSGFAFFMTVLCFISFLSEFDGTKIPLLIATLICFVSSFIVFILGVKSKRHTSYHLKEIMSGRRLQLKIVGFIESNIRSSGSSNSCKEYVLCFEEINDVYYRSNKCYTSPSSIFEIGSSIIMFYRSDTYFYIQTKEYLKNR